MNWPLLIALAVVLVLFAIVAATTWIDRRKPPVPADYDNEGV